MSNEKNKDIETADLLEFSIETIEGSTSGATSQSKPAADFLDFGLSETKEQGADALPVDPLFRLLAEPKLPELKKADRAKLQMQSPNRIHFYWSVKSNPYALLEKALGGRTGSYVLVARLKNLSTSAEKIFPVDAKGDWWFDVDSDTTYQAEIGFYAPNRPYVRIAYSNELRTPRKTPSLRTDYTPSFKATADEFAMALDAAGYKKDAFDVALAGDDIHSAGRATRLSYQKVSGKLFEFNDAGFESDLRFVLLALAAGYSLAEIEKHVNPTLFAAIKKDLEGITASNALNALEEHFDIVSDEIEEFEEVGSRVFGASVVNFPKRIRRKSFPASLVPRIDEFAQRTSVTSPVRR